MRTLSLLATLAAAALLSLAGRGDAARPAPGPGAVIHMHRQLFAAIDRGDVEAAQAFLHSDMNMDREWGQRPCQLFLVDAQGTARGGRDHAQSRALLARFVEEERAKGGVVETEVRPLSTDCFSEELSYGVMEVVRTRRDGEVERVERWISTALVTYAGGWRLTHLQLAPAPAQESDRASQR